MRKNRDLWCSRMPRRKRRKLAARFDSAFWRVADQPWEKLSFMDSEGLMADLDLAIRDLTARL